VAAIDPISHVVQLRLPVPFDALPSSHKVQNSVPLLLEYWPYQYTKVI